LHTIQKKVKTKTKNQTTYNSKRAVSDWLIPSVTIPGTTGHDTGIIGHDKRYTHLDSVQRVRFTWMSLQGHATGKTRTVLPGQLHPKGEK